MWRVANGLDNAALVDSLHVYVINTFNFLTSKYYRKIISQIVVTFLKLKNVK